MLRDTFVYKDELEGCLYDELSEDTNQYREFENLQLLQCMFLQLSQIGYGARS